MPFARAICSCARRGFDIVAIDEQDATGRDHVGRYVVGLLGQPAIAVPEHGAIAGTRVHQNDGTSRSSAGNRGGRQRDTLVFEARLAPLGKVIVAEPADVARAQSEARAPHHG